MGVKILKNTTGTLIKLVLVGDLRLPPSVDVTLTVEEYLYIARPDAVAEITPLLNSGDVVMKDGIATMTAARAIEFLKYPDMALSQRFLGNTQRSNGFPDNLTTQEAIELAKTGDGRSSMSINPGAENSRPFMKADVNQYTHLGSTLFLGTTKVGIPKNFIVSVEADKGADVGKTIDIKVFDSINANVLAEKIGIVLALAKTIIDLGAISNLPTGQVPIELQGRSGITNGGKGHVCAFKDIL